VDDRRGGRRIGRWARCQALSVIVWAASSFVEGLASMIVIWRFTGTRTLSEHRERTAQRLVAGSFLLLVPFFVYEAIDRLIVGSETTASALAIAVTASAIVLMPALGWAKLRLAERLGSAATAGEGVQNLMCAAQAATALIALIGAAAGLGVIDPIAALVISAIAAKESVELWRGETDECCAPVGFPAPQGRNAAVLIATAAELDGQYGFVRIIGSVPGRRRVLLRRSRDDAGACGAGDRRGVVGVAVRV
jgi:hypothetical protein